MLTKILGKPPQSHAADSPRSGSGELYRAADGHRECVLTRVRNLPCDLRATDPFSHSYHLMRSVPCLACQCCCVTMRMGPHAEEKRSLASQCVRKMTQREKSSSLVQPL